MIVTILDVDFWYEVDGRAELTPYGYYAVPYYYGSREFYDDEPVACGPRELVPVTWDLSDVCPF